MGTQIAVMVASMFMTLSFGELLLVLIYFNYFSSLILARAMSSVSSITDFGFHITIPIISLVISDWICI